jgi:iron complex transport system permease protein
MHPLKRKLPLLLIMLLLAIAAMIFSISFGSASIPASRIWTVLWQDDHSTAHVIIHQLRLPRSLSAFAVGALLGLAGALMQVLLRNPLGDPYILGISGGSAVAVLGAMLLGLPLIWHAPAATMGAMLSMLLVFALARRGSWNTTRLLLTGIVVAAGWSALISFVLSLSPPTQLPGMLFWLMGDLSDALSPTLPLLILGAGLLSSLWLSPRLNLAAQGELRAPGAGRRLNRGRWAYMSNFAAGPGALCGEAPCRTRVSRSAGSQNRGSSGDLRNPRRGHMVCPRPQRS